MFNCVGCVWFLCFGYISWYGKIQRLWWRVLIDTYIKYAEGSFIVYGGFLTGTLDLDVLDIVAHIFVYGVSGTDPEQISRGRQLFYNTNTIYIDYKCSFDSRYL